VFNTESVRRGLENIQKFYAKKGHPSVTAVPIASIDEKTKRIALEIKIQESAPSQ
jgi:outer membrane protein assembly factor BamA